MTSHPSYKRPPVVAIMGHVDHGKSSLLDYIRKANSVAHEAGGITQHLSAYEVLHTTQEGTQELITFIDTPGHAAFSQMRHRGATVADIAILIISAEESVKEQTREAIKTITEHNVPFIVAINKIDRPGAQPEKVKTDLLEEGVYVEGFGGDVPVVLISAKTGVGVPDLLETILLLAELQEFTGNPELPAEGFVIESHLDDKRGISATLIIKNGTLTKGQFVVVQDTFTKTRMLENFMGHAIDQATYSSPVKITGFSTLPEVGAVFSTCTTKREAELACQTNIALRAVHTPETRTLDEGLTIIPVIIKSDVYGTAEAIEHELSKHSTEDVWFKLIKKGVGAINESDIQLALSDKKTIIIGFHVDVEKNLLETIEKESLDVKTFSVIYHISEWLETVREHKRVKKNIEEITGTLKVLKVFSTTKKVTVLGGRITSGILGLKNKVQIVRGDTVLGTGVITTLQQSRTDVEKVTEGMECGIALESSIIPEGGDTLQAFIITKR